MIKSNNSWTLEFPRRSGTKSGSILNKSFARFMRRESSIRIHLPGDHRVNDHRRQLRAASECAASAFRRYPDFDAHPNLTDWEIPWDLAFGFWVIRLSSPLRNSLI